MEQKSRGGFTGKIGFVLAAAGSAVGLGNLWRFPYLAAKNGGGLFILTYLILSLTVGFALLTTEIAIGRKTGRSPLQAYGKLDKKFNFLGILATAVPIVIFPYYCVIGGWVTKYAATYVSGGAAGLYETGAGSFFTGFITANVEPLVWFILYMALNAAVVVLGVEKGIEKASKIIMPTLLVLLVGIVIYSFTLSHTDANGVTRTAWDGIKVYLIPDFKDLMRDSNGAWAPSFGVFMKNFTNLLLDAFGQMFYSLSVAMGIMITYGSYCKKDENLLTSVNQIKFFDSGVAILAGLIVVPSVFVFQGAEGLSKSGPSLMFVSLPQIFEQMGIVGTIVGALFFILVLFAALTSSISLMETIASSIIDKFHLSRVKATLITFVGAVLIGTVVCLGYSVWYADIPMPNGGVGQILDILDFTANSIMLPLVALATCVLIGWVYKPKGIVEEIECGLNGKKFYREKLMTVILKFVAPVLLVLIMLQAFGLFTFLG